MAGDLASFASRLELMATTLSGPDLKPIMVELGTKAKKDVEDALHGDLGDVSMSNWRRGSPIQLGGRFDVDGTTVSITPERRGSGPWRVLEEGRSAGGSHDMVLVGRTRKNGTRRGRSRGRNQGATRGKRTWSDAEKLIEQRFPERAIDLMWTAVQKRWG